MEYKLKFEELEWLEPDTGIRTKSFESSGKQIRLIELTNEFLHSHWCEVGHIGYVLEGELEIEFESKLQSYIAGDVIFIPEGAEHKHRPSCKCGLVSFISTEVL